MKARPAALRTGSAALVCAVGLALAALFPIPAAAGEGMRGPGPRATPRPPLGSRPPDFRPPLDEAGGPGAGFLLGLLRFYRTVVSPVDGDRCSMAPTDSLYSQQALQERGVLLGILLTADRLLHEPDEIPLAPRIVIGGETYYLDTIENNTYWLR